MWITTKNEHKDAVQRRWDNVGKIRLAFQSWREKIGHEYEAQTGGLEDAEGEEKERGHMELNTGWGGARSIPRIHIQVQNFLQKGIR
eukprot:2578809-Pleurochrysis_carterae.AAC.7